VNVGSLFSGAGLMDYGLACAGFDHAWFCESDPYCRRILERRWPGVPVYEDVRTLEAPERVDVLAGGFPCQDLSNAGRRAGITGERSGLWAHFARLIGELRPRYVLVENVPALLVRGMGRVLGDLAALRYDAEWDCVPAAAFGAPHLRARIFILAYPSGGRRPNDGLQEGWDSARGGCEALADADSFGRDWRARIVRTPGRGELAHGGRWATEPDVGRVAYGVPARVDRLRALGNGVVPQVSEWLGGRILEHEERVKAVAA
jgi:DNA (cytosine-5)-methyltransferase 1